MKNSVKVLVEMKKDRALSMSFDNNLLTEVRGTEYVVGLGYRIKSVSFNYYFNIKKNIFNIYIKNKKY